MLGGCLLHCLDFASVLTDIKTETLSGANGEAGLHRRSEVAIHIPETWQQVCNPRNLSAVLLPKLVELEKVRHAIRDVVSPADQ